MHRKVIVLVIALLAALVVAQPAAAQDGLTAQQRAVLYGIAKDTWRFYGQDVDPNTHLPLDNLGPGTVRGAYTSASNIGVYLWAVVAAADLGLVGHQQARSLITATLHEVRGLQRSDGFLYQWYDTTNGDTIRNPGDIHCKTETTPVQDNCFFLSAVDNGWYASGLVVVRQAMPELAGLVNQLIAPMNFGIFYDNRPQTACNTNPAIPGNQPTGQMFGGFYVGQGPAGYHNGALYSDPRIAMYLGMGLHQMPGDVWWRTWRTLPPQQCPTDPDFSWQGQWPVAGVLAEPTRSPVRQGVPRLGGPLHLSRHVPDLRADLGRRLVRGTDGRPGRAGDRVGPAQLRPGRRAHGAGPAEVRDADAGLPGVGPVAVQHRRRHRRLRRLRRRGPRVSGQTATVPVHRLRHRDHGDTARVGHRAGRAAATGIREHPDTAHAVPRRLHVRRRFLRRGEPDDRRDRPPAAGARPVHDHGGPGQRTEPRRPATTLRRTTRWRGRPTRTCPRRPCRSGD